MGGNSSSLWRSEDMNLVRITMQREAVHTTVEAVGELGLVEFIDIVAHSSESALRRQYSNEVRRCEELERILRFFQEQLKKAKSEVNTNSIRSITGEEENSRSALSLDHLEQEFGQYEQQLRQLNGSLEQLTEKKIKEVELLHVINQGSEFLRLGGAEEEQLSSSESASTQGSDTALVEESTSRSGTLGYVTGVIPRDKVPTFNLLMYRATRGNVIPRFAEIKNPLFDARAGKEIEKNVFIVFFGGNRSKEKIKKICDSLGASVHDYPEQDAQSAKQTCEATIEEYEKTIQQTKHTRGDILGEIAAEIENWKRKVAREKAIFHTMNLFNYNVRDSAIAEAWVPKSAFDLVYDHLNDAQVKAGAQVATVMEVLPADGHTPPTYFQTNQFTQVFQNIVNAYGVPRYKELNPAPISIISFPFLFAVMFGDYGHGVIFTMFAISLIILAKPLAKISAKNEMIGMIYGGRWVMLLMGLFSIFTGLLYNDCFSLSLDLFGTAYDFDENTLTGTKVRGTYAFGVDPAWYGTNNRLAFYNSLKMKMSIVFGVTQMMIGIFFSCLNHLKFKHYEDIFFEFIPEVNILGFSFGYLCFMIIFKWCTNYNCPPGATDCKAPPSLLATMTDFFLSPHEIKQPYLFKGQLIVQLVFLGIFVLSVPVLLIPKPLFELIVHSIKKKRQQKGNFDQLEDPSERSEATATGSYQVQEEKKKVLQIEEIAPEVSEKGSEKSSEKSGEKKEEKEKPKAGHDDHDEFNFSDIVIKQLIHTIEFTLGAVSNTASYLRLWALSLAHSQLAEVFWDMTMKIILTIDIPFVQNVLVSTGIGVAIVFIIWFNLTVGILLGMESLSAFLHALRLHWVEFQSKFFVGDGYLFTPFNFKEIDQQLMLEQEDE